MGLDAFVACRCYADGLTTSAPVPVAIDPETGDVDLVEWSREASDAFHEWQADACWHARQNEDRLMLAADEWLSNWSGVGSFGSSLTMAARSLCPNLLGEWAHITNGGTVSAELSAVMLEELALLEDVALDVVRLQLPKPGPWRDIDATDLGGQWAVLQVCDDFQLVITDLSGRVQVLDGTTHVGWTSRYRVLDVDGRRTVVVPRVGASVSVDPRVRGPLGTHVLRPMRTTLADHQRNIVDALRCLFTASVETRNPVCWT